MVHFYRQSRIKRDPFRPSCLGKSNRRWQIFNSKEDFESMWFRHKVWGSDRRCRSFITKGKFRWWGDHSLLKWQNIRGRIGR